MPSQPSSRLAYIDWMRGLACLLMFQTHCYDSWLTPQARQTKFFQNSQILGTLPAPLFLFLAGVSFALVTQRLWDKQIPTAAVARTTILRGAEILGFGLLFRLQEYVIAWGWAPWSDLFRVDILNTIGVSMMLMGVACWMASAFSPDRTRVGTAALGCPVERSSTVSPPLSAVLAQRTGVRTRRAIVAAVACMAAITTLTPLLWTVWDPRWLPWPLLSYINGCHNLAAPQPWLFPIFPWSAFAFAGLATGFTLQSDAFRNSKSRTAIFAALGGVTIAGLGYLLDSHGPSLYPVYDFWHTSPNFFLIRLGILLMILAAVDLWCRWGAATIGFSPFLIWGQASLLVYWVHIEFVYGRVSIMRKQQQSIASASVGLLIICVAMLALAWLRINYKSLRQRLVTLAHSSLLLA